ncbi:hypothetical protein [Methylobacterium sp. NEAU K]|uniref:hypothetical protein n=1 Tax=Methylobacterium sp. NEAU K TaxID=3064946 RepID=UPI0027337FD5|nr:hypothetical protein [Methylobacterium sp. NEAU K]MDP4005064.1 hypothetical protein [Methylobacterium sp. NEAU K]
MNIPPRGNALSQANLDKHGDAIRDLATGGTNASGDVTLVANATSTPVTDKLCTTDTMVVLSPRSASAAAAPVFVRSTGNGTFTLGHDASAATDRAFHYELRRR